MRSTTRVVACFVASASAVIVAHAGAPFAQTQPAEDRRSDVPQLVVDALAKAAPTRLDRWSGCRSGRRTGRPCVGRSQTRLTE